VSEVKSHVSTLLRHVLMSAEMSAGLTVPAIALSHVCSSIEGRGPVVPADMPMDKYKRDKR
jgi:hypothetical protein